MNKDDLIASWALTEKLLNEAFDLLPQGFKEGSSSTKKSFYGYLEQNELELALEQIEGIAELNSCSKEFWEQMILAAENMALDETVDYYRTKIKSLDA